MSDIINIDCFETIETIEITTYPTYNEINVNRVSGSTGGAVNSVNGQTGDVVINIPSAQVNSDWNATTGVASILNKPTIGVGDMLKSTYDTDNSGVVDNAETIIIVGRNATGSVLRRGTVVYINGSTGNRPNFIKAQANIEATSAGTFGIIKDDVANNADGNCCVLGYLDNLDTRSIATFPFTNDTLADGDTIYLSPTTAGYITNIKPSAPNHLVYIGKVVRTSPTNGTIVYRIQNGYELAEIHDVAISGVADKQLLSYDNATQLWKNKSVTTNDIAPSTNKNYLTDAQQIVINNTSGTNTGDNATNSQYSGLSSSKEDTANKSTSTTDSASTIKFPVWSAILSYFDASRIRTLLGITTLSGSNTGDQDLSGLAPKANPTFTGTATTPAIVVSSETANTIASFDASKNIKSLPVATYPSLTELAFLKGVTSSIQTQFSNLPAFSQSGLTAYTDTIVWTATTAPSGTTNFTYNWVKIGNQVTLTISLIYGTNGTGVTVVSMNLPSGAPTPIKPTGLSGASNILYQGSGKMMASVTSTTVVNSLASLRSNSANNGFELIIVQGSGTFTTASITIQYFTA